MKRFLILFLGLLALSSPGQGTSIRSLNGIGTNTLIVNGFDVNTFANASILSVGPAAVDAKTNIVGRAGISTLGVFSGNGSGLTNLAVLTTNNIFINNVTNNNLSVTNNTFLNNVTVTNISTFKGNAQFTSNAYFLNLNFTTNLATTLVIAVGQTAQAVQTNNNINFTGYSGIDGTNAQPFTLLVTNTAGSAAPKFYQFPAGTIMLSSPYTNGVYNTNQGAFSGWIYPGFGTNATWVGN